MRWCRSMCLWDILWIQPSLSKRHLKYTGDGNCSQKPNKSERTKQSWTATRRITWQQRRLLKWTWTNQSSFTTHVLFKSFFKTCGHHLAEVMVFICRGEDGVVVWSWLSLKAQPGSAVCTFSEAPVSCAALVALYTEIQTYYNQKCSSPAACSSTYSTLSMSCTCLSSQIMLRFVFC